MAPREVRFTYLFQVKTDPDDEADVTRIVYGRSTPTEMANRGDVMREIVKEGIASVKAKDARRKKR